MRITSTANPVVKAALALRQRRERERTGLTIVDGAREVLRALTSGVDIAELFVSEERCTDPMCEAALDEADSWTPVSAAVIDRLGYGDRSEGIVAVVRSPSTALSDLRLRADALVMVLEAVEKPGNIGAVLRSADGAGADALLLADPRTDPFNPNAIRASLGTVFTLPIAAGTASDVRGWLRERGTPVVAARVDADRDYWQADLRGGVAIALGSERHGLGPLWRGDDVIAVRLPMLGVADSLNVSATAAVLLYEARRQRAAV